MNTVTEPYHAIKQLYHFSKNKSVCTVNVINTLQQRMHYCADIEAICENGENLYIHNVRLPWSTVRAFVSVHDSARVFRVLI
jgi:uncharacterized protein related to proFAR isomerase